MEGYKSDSSKTEPNHAEINTQPELKSQIKSILDNVIDDFNSKWSSHSDQRQGIDEATDKIITILEPVAPIDKTLSAEDELQDIPMPIGHFIMENAEGVLLDDGKYYHYSDVCRLLKLRVEQAKEETITFLKKCIDSCDEQIENFVNNGMDELTGGSAAMKCAYQVVLRQIQPDLFYGK